MPRGVPNAGFRKTAAFVQRQNEVILPPKAEIEQNETDEQISARLSERFDVLASFVEAAVEGACRALIVSGPAGLGKSFTVEEGLAKRLKEGQYTITKGYVKTTGLYKLLYQHRHENSVIVFDDADSILFDDISLNILKAACDTTDRRRVSYLAETNMIDEDSAERIPRTFDFDGTIIFITNLDFDSLVSTGHRLAPHLSALMSRSHYIDVGMKTKRDYIVRIKQVVAMGLLSSLSEEAKNDVVQFIEVNRENLRELSLRMALKVASIRERNPVNWERVARVTCCRN